MTLSKEEFFRSMERQGIALTFDDVTLATQHSEVLPAQVRLESRFSTNVPLKVPFVSAAMDTVTESRMAIAMAMNGGIGVIHKNLTPEQQAYQVARVKYRMHGMVVRPRTFRETHTIEQVLNKSKARDWDFHTFPIVDGEKKLVGVLSRADWYRTLDLSTKVEDVMTSDLVTVDSKVELQEAYRIMQDGGVHMLPLVDNQGHLEALYLMRDVHDTLTGDRSAYNTNANGQLLVGAAVGLGDLEARAEALAHHNVDVFVLDSAHGDTKSMIEALTYLKKNYGQDVVIGNVTEPHSVRRLVDAGADGIKIGQGPGSICTTRKITGVGTPQITAVYHAAQEANDIPVCADGGIKYSGDVVKALAAGANSVMMGGGLAGTIESPGKEITVNGVRMKQYRGMGSGEAMAASSASRERYSQGSEKFVSEGVSAAVPLRGPLADTLNEHVGGLRSGMGYQGARDIDDLQDGAQFHRLLSGGMIESSPHSVTQTKDEKNFPTGGGR